VTAGRRNTTSAVPAASYRGTRFRVHGFRSSVERGTGGPAAPPGPGDPGRLLDSILHASTASATIAIDSAGRIVIWNRGAERLHGYAGDEVVGRSHAVLCTDEDVRAGMPERIVARAVADGIWEGTLERRRKDGSHFTAQLTATVLDYVGDGAPGTLLVSHEITDQVALERELVRLRANAESMIESAPDAMIITQPDGSILLANAQVERMFGYTRAELMGRPLELLLPERYAARHVEHRAQFFAVPSSRPMGRDLELWARHKDGQEFPVEIALSPLTSPDGPVATAAIRDASERRRTEQALRAANEELEAASRAKDEFLASMSHELRTPLNAILGFTGTMLMGLPGPLTAEQVKQLEIVQSNGRHLLSLINDLLDVARIRSGKRELQPEPIGVRALLSEVADGLRTLADAKGVALEVAREAPDLEVLTDRRALKQILINLASNAIKFTDEGAVLLAAARQLGGHDGPAGDTVRFSVSDTGRGIRPEDQRQLFEAFAQIAPQATRPVEGTGLGLYICRMLTEALGGKLGLESRFGIGSTFWLELPG
jgi:PAS domain S-box-containing protein